MEYKDFVKRIVDGSLTIGPQDTYYLNADYGKPSVTLVTIGVNYKPPSIGNSHRIMNVLIGATSVLIIFPENLELNMQIYTVPISYKPYCEGRFYWFLPRYIEHDTYFKRCRFRGRRDVNVYPRDLLEALQVNESMLMNPFQIHGYHASGMRTNVGQVRTFLKVDGETEANTYLGLELELCGYNNDTIYDIDEFMAEPVNKDVFDHFDVSHDSSLDDMGLELVSLPMTHKYILSKKHMFDKIYTLIREKDITNKYGSMHIHFDKSFISQVIKGNGYMLLNFVWNNSANHNHQVNYIVGRAGNRWCAFSELGSSNIDFIRHNHARWLSNTGHTIEIRRYGANLNTDDLFLKINFTMEIFNKVMELQNLPNSDLNLGYIVLEKIIQKYYLQKVDLVGDFKKVANNECNWNDIFPWWN